MSTLSKPQKTVSLILKVITALSALVGTYLSALAGRNSFMGGMYVFMYFTIQSNLAIAAICLVGAYLLCRKGTVKNSWYILQFVGAVSITLTGMVFCFVLAPTMGKHAWSLQNVLTHVVVPVLAVVDFFVSATPGRFQKSDVFYVILPPLAYAAYAGIGYVCNWQFSAGVNYPYFFLNWGSPAGAFGFTKGLPFMGCVWWILLLLAFLCAVGRLYLWGIEKVRK